MMSMKYDRNVIELVSSDRMPFNSLHKLINLDVNGNGNYDSSDNATNRDSTVAAAL